MSMSDNRDIPKIASSVSLHPDLLLRPSARWALPTEAGAAPELRCRQQLKVVKLAILDRNDSAFTVAALRQHCAQIEFRSKGATGTTKEAPWMVRS
jgi:hypothetical protein